MKAVFNWRDMEQFGIDFLTGEACGVGLRVLCDLNKRGMKLIGGFFGFDPETLFPGLNRGERSVMLPRSILHDLAVYAMLDTGCKAVISMEHRTEIHGAVTDAEVEQIERLVGDETQYPKVERVYKATGTAPGGLRNVHEMSGRIV